tara:strand:- start:685 stop:1215 length:531 start_codon:yes stop_codon:yes gene_type:complete
MDSQNAIWVEEADLCADNWQSMVRTSKTWVYVANRALSKDECKLFMKDLQAFTAEWQAHGKNLTSSWRLCGNRLLIIAVDESAAPATGCSIDSSVAFLRDASKAWQERVDWFDRQSVIYKHEDVWRQANNASFWALKKAKRVTDHTNLVKAVYAKSDDCWGNVVIPYASSWHAEMW